MWHLRRLDWMITLLHVLIHSVATLLDFILFLFFFFLERRFKQTRPDPTIVCLSATPEWCQGLLLLRLLLSKTAYGVSGILPGGGWG